MRSRIIICIATIFCIFIHWPQFAFAQVSVSDSTFQGIQLRNIGPAFMSGRIADIAIHPENDNLWYVAVGSGGVWKTVNAGVTWKPIFDDQSVYSIGCVSLDPNNPNIVWVGTGENVGGRHVGYGDGIYKSEDGGNSWENMGLKESQHISKIIIHPENSKVLFVAVQGPLWSKGGERGFYKSADGGKTWNKTLGDEAWTGVTDIAIDPRNPEVLYAATWQRHRNVAAYMGGGPNSGLHKSLDGGESWTKLDGGLPAGNIGKIGLAISPVNPDVLYAAIEQNRREGAVYRSEDRGANWTMMSETVSGGTGPHYYQELYASPHQLDKIFLANVRMLVSDDGGKTFYTMKEEHKHSDNHALAFRNDDPDYLLVGTDGGLYESFDLAENWRYMANLPLTQFYKVAVDDAEPFYFIYGGTQDNSTQGGPSRTDNEHGIRNADWFLTLFADGHQPATEPGNPDIMYSEWQEGNLMRVDRITGERVYIKPQPAEGEPQNRFNWDSPILVSPHNPTTLYFASQKVWKSENRGDSWKAISGDLTKNQERITLPIMGKTQSWDAPWDMFAMSAYNTITSLAESPVRHGLLYAGTDDGIIQVTEDGGSNWRKILVSELPGVPETAFVNDIKADLYDENTVYAVLDNHKFGDLNPYLFKSTNKGKSWKSMKSNLPDKTLLWRIVQDHQKPELMFLATEFGIYFTIDAGGAWYKFTGEMPTISFRDLAIQKRENDLIGASFGRGFFVLDDYSFMRELTTEQLQSEAVLFPGRKAWWYIQKGVVGFGEGKGSMGADYYTAPNPPFGAVLTYYLKEDVKSIKETRQELEKQLIKENKNVPFPGWDKLDAEQRQEAPKILLTIKDANENVVRKISAPTEKGFHRIAWDLSVPSKSMVSLEPPETEDEDFMSSGRMVAPGKYTAQLSRQVDGVTSNLGEPIEILVEPLRKGALNGAAPDVVAGFWRDLDLISGEVQLTATELQNAKKKVDAMQRALAAAEEAPGDLDKKLHVLQSNLLALDQQLNGSPAKREVGELDIPSVQQRMMTANMGTAYSTYGPTPMHIESLDIAKSQHEKIRNQLIEIANNEIPALKKELDAAGAPNIEGFLD
jgi:photosystem II stability/assembly factor-like uncharacterized protein